MGLLEFKMVFIIFMMDKYEFIVSLELYDF